MRYSFFCKLYLILHLKFYFFVYLETPIYRVSKLPCVNGFLQVMLAILIGLLTILTWHFTKIYTTKSINGLAYGLRYELLQRPILRMWNILNSTVEITTAQVKLSEYVIKRYSNPTTQAQQVEVDYSAILLLNTQFSNVFFGLFWQ